MDVSKFDVILDAASESFMEDFKKAIGLKPGETLQIITPQFTRTDGRTIQWIPKTEREFEALKVMDQANLRLVGCQIWDRKPGSIHWLYPSEWYASIPDGYEITDINGTVENFQTGVTDDDIRFGCLAYGFIQSGQ